MAEYLPLTLANGVVTRMSTTDTVPASIIPVEADIHCGVSTIVDLQTIIVKANKQMLNFTRLRIDGDLILDGDLWLA